VRSGVARERNQAIPEPVVWRSEVVQCKNYRKMSGNTT
jgi:hypothetical protein